VEHLTIRSRRRKAGAETYNRDEGVGGYNNVLSIGTIFADSSRVQDCRTAIQSMNAAVNSENGIEFSLLHSMTVDFGSESVELLEHMLGKCINTNLTGIPQPSWPKIYFRVSNETPLKSATSLWHTGVCVEGNIIQSQ
jgi:hypothetical protein